MIRLFVLLFLFNLHVEWSSIAAIKSSSNTLDITVEGINKITIGANSMTVGNASANLDLNIQGDLHLSETIQFTPVSLSGDSILGENSLVLLDSQISGGDFTVNLPFSGNAIGRSIQLIKTSREHTVSLTNGLGSGGFNQNSTRITLDSSKVEMPNVELVSGGNNWYVVNASANVEEHFFPIDLKNRCSIWLDASDKHNNIELDSTHNTVTTWINKGDGPNFVEKDGKGAPKLVENWRVNNLSAVQFDQFNGNSSANINILETESSLTSDNTGFTIFTVSDFNTQENNDNVAMFMFQAGTNNPTVAICNGKNTVGIFTSSSDDYKYHRSDLGSRDACLSTFSYSQLKKTMKYKVYDLNTQVELISKSFTYDGYEKGLGGTSGQAWFGCQKQSQPKRAYGGNIGEFIMCDGELNENDIEKVETYLKNKWK